MQAQQELAIIKHDFTALGAKEPQPNVPATVTVTSQSQRDKANELFLRTRARLKALKAQVKSEKDAAKAELEKKLAPLTVEQQLLEVMDSALERGIIKYDDDVAEAARKEQERQTKLYEKRLERADKKAEETGQAVVVAPPPVVQVPQKTQAVAGVGTSTVRIDYTYEIPGCPDPSGLRLNHEAARKMLPRYFKFNPPPLSADHPDVAEIAKAHPEWFGLSLMDINRDVKASKGEQSVPGIIIKERKGLAGRLA